jgi:uncharacterized membrane protein
METDIREITKEKKQESLFGINSEYLTLFKFKIPIWLIIVVIVIILLYIFLIRGKTRSITLGDMTFQISSEPSPLETELRVLLE